MTMRQRAKEFLRARPQGDLYEAMAAFAEAEVRAALEAAILAALEEPAGVVGDRIRLRIRALMPEKTR